ncbi:hypothetical protein BGY98DRAFT_1009841 [Russula aff. rugulosa BPL654]|nr:hypothetical protein BGY98DRAFT_1009841 [Russula aff. rugulosa BPL654]
MDGKSILTAENTNRHQTRASSDSGPTVYRLERTANRSPMLCPGCKEHVGYRQRELRRHLLLVHLPCWICCPYPSCTWRGTRKEELRKHWIKDKCGPRPEQPRPEQEQYRIYDTDLILGWILEDDTPVQVAASYALGFVGERARELGKVESWSNLWGR